MKLTKDNFVWDIVPTLEVADAYARGEVFILHDDEFDSESLYTGEALNPDLIYGTEVGWLKDIDDRSRLTILLIKKYGHITDTQLLWRFVALSTNGLINMVKNDE
jgi:hypothetical protein